jgi:hypothetical protein
MPYMCSEDNLNEVKDRAQQTFDCESDNSLNIDFQCDTLEDLI